MSQHNKTDFKNFTKPQMDAGLVLHGLEPKTPSQLSDGFRCGADWGASEVLKSSAAPVDQVKPSPDCESIHCTDDHPCPICFDNAEATAKLEAETWIVVKEHVWKHEDRERPTLAYLLPCEFGRVTYPSFEAASAFIKAGDLPLGWVAMKLDTPTATQSVLLKGNARSGTSEPVAFEEWLKELAAVFGESCIASEGQLRVKYSIALEDFYKKHSFAAPAQPAVDKSSDV